MRAKRNAEYDTNTNSLPNLLNVRSSVTASVIITTSAAMLNATHKRNKLAPVRISVLAEP